MKILLLALFLVQISLVWSKNHATTHHIDSVNHRYKYEYEAHHDRSLPLPFHTLELHQDDDSRIDNKKRLLASLDSELTPLYQGYGTHFSYVYVGTPPQRQSVIIDTGSHFTAFPCTGCSQCGQHTDKYWDIKNSSTAEVKKCGNQPCTISQSYSEGSSWRAIQVIDKLWVGALALSQIPTGDKYTVDFTFGCQTYETGLFRTQLADGIMGMSMSADTLPYILKSQGVVDTQIFALCFRVGGGIMTLGGVDQRVHGKSTAQYAKMKSSNGWYQINLKDIRLKPQDGSESTSISASSSLYNNGKGTIVDSGTTDTYLPAAINSKFTSLFKSISGVGYSNGNVQLSQDQLRKLPDIVFIMEGVDGSDMTVVMPWSSYVDSVGGGKYAFRVYLTESSGAVLGANFMNGNNVIFDSEGKRIGFSPSVCKYEDFGIPLTRKPTSKPTSSNRPPTSPDDDDFEDNDDNNIPCVSRLVPTEPCSALCTSTNAYIAVGTQKWADVCGNPTYPGTGVKTCHESCVAGKPVRGNPFCYEKPWTQCDEKCTQSRSLPTFHGESPPINETYDEKDSKCGTQYAKQSRLCYTNKCAMADGDYFIYMDLRVQIQPSHWSYVHSEAFYGAFEMLFNVKEQQMELLNDAGNEYTIGTKLHFEIRLKQNDYNTVTSIVTAAEAIVTAIWEEDFNDRLIDALNTFSSKYDKVDQSRFGWFREYDIEILNAMAVPYGDTRDPIEIESDKGWIGFKNHFNSIINGQYSEFEMVMIGVMLGLLFILAGVVCCYIRLKQEHFELQKEKNSGGLLLKMYNKLKSLGRSNNSSNDGRGRYSQVQMSDRRELGSIPEADNELDDDDDFQGIRA